MRDSNKKPRTGKNSPFDNTTKPKESKKGRSSKILRIGYTILCNEIPENRNVVIACVFFRKIEQTGLPFEQTRDNSLIHLLTSTVRMPS